MDQVQIVIQKLCDRVKSPMSERVKALVKEEMWAELQRLSVDPLAYGDAYHYWADAMCVDLVRKAKIPSANKPALAAVSKFLETEHDCYRVNRRLLDIKSNTGLSWGDDAFIGFLGRWKEKIKWVMGRVPQGLDPSFSGGASTSTTKLYSTKLDKMSTAPRLYSHSADVIEPLLYRTGWGKIIHENGLYPKRDKANVYFTVPKTGLTDRSCAKEPTLNMCYQLAVGKHLRERLTKTLNIDLNHGAELHRIRAREGSIFDDVATLDLSSASDRWARELVRYLVPWDWEILLNSLRATHTSFGGKTLYLQKFSSMGNGFTFELETILFVTLALVVQDDEQTPGEILCYGDDLIVPAVMATALIARLHQVGHKINQQKSFISGPFRESCGGDYFKGEPVNTVKLSEIPEDPHHWISLANQLRRVAAGRPRYWAMVKPVWEHVIRQLPNQLRTCRGPSHLGDQVIHDHAQHWAPRDLDGFIRTYRPVVARRSVHDRRYTAELAKLLYLVDALPPEKPGMHSLMLPRVTGYRLKWGSPQQRSDWTPDVAFRVVDPRVNFARRYTGYYPLE